MDFNAFIIDDIVTVKLNNSNKIIGKFEGYDSETKRITLKNVRFQYNDLDVHSKSNLKFEVRFEEFSINCQHILEINNMEENKQDSSSLVKAECSLSKSGVKPMKLSFQKGMQTRFLQSMEVFCKNLFDSTNFAHLLENPDKKIEIGLPKYFAEFLRQPTLRISNNDDDERLFTSTTIPEESNNSAQSICKTSTDQPKIWRPEIIVHQIYVPDDNDDDDDDSDDEYILEQFDKFFNNLCNPEFVAREGRDPIIIEDVTHLFNCSPLVD